MCAQLCMQGEGGRDSGLGRINHFYGTLWGVSPPGTAEKTRPIQASEKLPRFPPMCKQHAGACCFHFYYPPTGQSGDYCRWKHIALSFYFTRASFQYGTLARLEQCRTAAMGNMSPVAATNMPQSSCDSLCPGMLLPNFSWLSHVGAPPRGHLQPSRVSVDLPTMTHRQIPFQLVGPKGAL